MFRSFTFYLNNSKLKLIGKLKKMQEQFCPEEADAFGMTPSDYTLLNSLMPHINNWDRNLETALYFIYNDDNKESKKEKLLLMKVFIDYGADVNARMGIEKTLLHYAVYDNDFDTVKLLLENGANPNIRDDNNSAALYYAVSKKARNDQIIRLLLQYGADPNDVNTCYKTPLFRAAITERLDLMPALVNAGAKTYHIYSLMLKAFRDDNVPLFNYLLNHGTEIDARGKFSLHALLFKAYEEDSRNEYAEALDRLLFVQGVDTRHLKSQWQKMTALHFAALQENEAKIRHLLEKGVDVNAKNIYDNTPLHVLLYNRNGRSEKVESIARLLIEAGADVSEVDCLGRTAFQVALKNNHLKVVTLALSKISGIEESALADDTGLRQWLSNYDEPLFDLYELAVAVILGHKQLVDRLIDMGHKVDFESHNITNKPPLYFAIKTKQYDIAKMIFETGLEVDGYFPHCTSAFDPKACTDNDLEFICLLWEFDCRETFRKLLVHTIHNYLSDRQVVSKLIYLCVFYYSIDLRLNRLSKDYLPIRGVFRLVTELLPVFTSCNDTLNNLLEVQVCNDVNYFDILTTTLDSLVKFLNNEDNFIILNDIRSLLKNKKELRYDEYAMKIRLDLAIEKKTLLDYVKNYLNSAFQTILESINFITLPDEIMGNILSNFTTRDLKRIVNKN